MQRNKPQPGDAAREIHARNVAPGETGGCRPRPHGAVYLGNYAAEPLPIVRAALVGMGARGRAQAECLADVAHCEVVAVCDLQADAARAAADVFLQRGGRRPAEYAGSPDAYRDMLREVHPDAVFIDTPWEQHAQMAIVCMQHGAHAFVEVPLALTLQELWAVVDTAERTRRHCMMLEEVNYGRNELMFLNLVRQGAVGELLHGEAAYLHDLRGQMHPGEHGGGLWRNYHHIARNGNLYPTHGLGPVSQYMGLARGEDTFERLVSMSSPALGRELYVRKFLPAGSRWHGARFACGDINSSIIRTVRGRTICVQWDETTPRPYDRKNVIQGSGGVLADFPLRAVSEPLGLGVAEEGKQGAECTWYTGADAEEYLHAHYDHPLFRRLAAQAQRYKGRGGMNFIMLTRIMENLHAGRPMDQNVYEGAFWSAVAPLSEKSVHEGGAPQLFPDFTRGGWRTTRAVDLGE